MKLRQVKNIKDYLAEDIYDTSGDEDIVTPEVGDKFAELNKLDKGYAQLSRLAAVMNTGQWGALIDNNGKLAPHDIILIKAQLHDIIYNNPLLAGSHSASTPDGKEALRLLGHEIGHALELALELATASILGSIAGSALVSGAASWTTPIEFVAAAGMVALAGRQVHFIEDLHAAQELVQIINAYDNIGSYDTVQRSPFRKFLDWVEGKSPQDIQIELKHRSQLAAAKATAKFNELAEKLPPDVMYWKDGKPFLYPTIDLFSTSSVNV